MNNKIKIMALGIATVMLTVSLFLTGCVEEENKIIVGTSADFPPFEYIGEDGTIIGFDIEMVTIILEEAGYTVEVKDISFDSLIPSLENNKIDVIAAAMTITEEREEQIDFSDPYYEADQSVLIHKDADLNLTVSQNLQNYTVGAQTGTTGAAWVQDNLIDNGTMNDEDFKRYETYTLAVLDLVNGNIDALVLDKPVAESFVKSRDVKLVMTIITGESYGLGVKEGNSDLLGEINSGLASLMDSTQWDTLRMKYFG
jgi:polar amino acid transport system substrate-binding protein